MKQSNSCNLYAISAFLSFRSSKPLKHCSIDDISSLFALIGISYHISSVTAIALDLDDFFVSSDFRFFVVVGFKGCQTLKRTTYVSEGCDDITTVDIGGVIYLQIRTMMLWTVSEMIVHVLIHFWICTKKSIYIVLSRPLL